MERRYELDGLRRSLMILSPGVPGLSWEEALRLVVFLCRAALAVLPDALRLGAE